MASRRAALLALLLPAVSLADIPERASGRFVTLIVSEVAPRTKTPRGGHCLAWPNRAVHFRINDRGSASAGCTVADSIARTRVAVELWNGSGCSDVHVSASETTTRSDVGYRPDAGDNLNLIVFRTGRCAAVVPQGDPCLSDRTCNNKYNCWDGELTTVARTLSTFKADTGEVVDMDIEVFDGDADRAYLTCVDSGPTCAKPGASSCVFNDLQTAVSHEVGHALGLDHATSLAAIMGATAEAGTVRRKLHGEDLEGLCAVYPAGKATPTCGSAPKPPERGCAAGAAGIWSLAALLPFGRRRRSA